MPVTLVVWKLRLEDWATVAILSYIARPCKREEGKREGRKDELREGVEKQIIRPEGTEYQQGGRGSHQRK